MRSHLQVLSADELNQIHERTLKILANTGVKVMSEQARRILGNAGADINHTTQVVRFPRQLIEEALKLATKNFNLGGRRPNWKVDLNTNSCTLLADGGAVSVLDFETGELRPSTFDDWLKATQLIDTLDEIGIYWMMVESGYNTDSLSEFVTYWHQLFKYCSKHMQDSTDSPEKSNLLIEMLQVVFGSQEEIKRRNPFSFLLCPMSPLTIDDVYTNSYLEIAHYGMPVAIMPMPLMGTTAPASIISTLLIANCELIAMLCLIQATAPGTPIIYAPVAHSIEPHTWRYTGGAVENALFGAAVTEMGRYYGLPVEAATGGTDQYYPGAQAGYERALNWIIPTLSYPDILVGPGLLGGSTILCLEQMVMDVEVFRRCNRLSEGIPTDAVRWMDEVIADVGPGGNFLARKSTVRAIREGRWYMSEVGFHDTYENWRNAGMPDIVDEIQEIMQELLNGYELLPLDSSVEKELDRIEKQVRVLEK